ncbi:Kynurenine--oxoglutarate transaminase 3 [Penaeus vannamei]|uniref:kynurenine--oxoglutarate transaminase n=1 Tax=Penaeus vannamei TaxID=6689 RepID=A0A423TW55_PENVA|nr:Kynurenine--oxoglutarate transaminase 3 [Penaeus vannamei]
MLTMVEFIQLALEVKPLNLGQGFPDFAAPDTVRKALAEACTDEKNVLLNQYTRGFGHPRLIAALSKLYSKLIGRELNPLSEVLVTAGAYEALFVTIMGLVNQGDEVIIIEPFFDCYVPQVKLAGGTPVFVPLRPRKPSGTMSSADWILDPAELEAAFIEQ